MIPADDRRMQNDNKILKNSLPRQHLRLMITNAVLAGNFSQFCYRFAFFDRLLGSLLTLYRPLLSTQTYPR
ncbi:MAG: hypothetical protein ACKO96_43960, partial [Flammeovirgaceae bacterium]